MPPTSTPDIEILYFAWVRERMARPGERLTLPEGIATVGALATWLQHRDDNGARAFAHPQTIRAAVNQDAATPETAIAPGDEVAFFPPVTGG